MNNNAVFNNVKTISNEELDRVRKNDRVDPFVRWVYDVEYRLRRLEKVAANGEAAANELDELDQENLARVVADTATTDSEEETTDSEKSDFLEVVEQFDAELNSNIDETEFYLVFETPEEAFIMSPTFGTEEELREFVSKHKDTYLALDKEDFHPFWDEDTSEDDEE